MDKKAVEAFDSALYGVGERIKSILFSLPPEIKAKIQEIRLRTGSPLALTVMGKCYFAGENSQVSVFPNSAVIVDKKDIDESFKALCKNSVYSRTDEIKNGYISMDYGHRAGVCGSYSADFGFNHISSVNIRIARQVLGAADFLISEYFGGGVLIAGPPASGKTTILRDFVRQLSMGVKGEFYRVAVIDQRGEIASCFSSKCYNDLGVCTDILTGIEKGKGVEIALRTLNPQFIAFDEIGSEAELNGVKNCIAAGTDIITTAHIGSKEELKSRNITRNLLSSGAIKCVALLSKDINEAKEIINTKEVWQW